jgi:hypothetical protein
VTRRAAERRVVTASEFWNILFQFLLNSVQELCSYHAPSLSVAEWRPTRRDFWPATFSDILMPLILIYIVRRSDALWIVNLLRAQTKKDLTSRSLGT